MYVKLPPPFVYFFCGRNRLAKSDELLRCSRGETSRRSSLDGDDLGDHEKSKIRTSSIALLKSFDVGDMHGFLSAWSVRTERLLKNTRPKLEYFGRCSKVSRNRTLYFGWLFRTSRSPSRCGAPRKFSIDHSYATLEQSRRV